MERKKLKIIALVFFAVFALAMYFIFVRNRPVMVEKAKVRKGAFIETIEADGFFRSKNKYTVTAFSDGDIKRVDLRVGDVLKKNQAITELYWDVKYVPVKAPINGVVTKIFRESAGPVHRGEAIIEMIDPDDLEIVAELLTTDAARLKVGNEAIIAGYGDQKKINARVIKISKAGFVKISALGVEEERTEVIMAPINLTRELRAQLGHTFHTQVLIQVAKHENVLIVPTGALVRDGSSWAVYLVMGNKARLKHITPSYRGNEEVVISEGVSENDVVINYPGDIIREGVTIK